MRAAVQDATQVLDERREKREERRQVMDARRRRKKRLLWITTACVGALVLLINLFLYLSPQDLPVEPFDPGKDPFLTAALINMAIQEYAEAHGDRFPETLTDLLKGGHLPSQQITEDVLKGFAYSRPSPRSYELRIREKEGGTLSDIVFTQEDR